METFLFKPEEYALRYNCTFYDPNSIPMEERRHVMLGLLFVMFSFICTILYLCCLYTIARTDLIRITSYRLMFLLGVFHIIGIQACGMLTGVYSVAGAVFCAYPTEIYITGGVALGTWVGSTTATVLLGLNRCLKLYSPAAEYLLFNGIPLIIVILMPIYRALRFFIFTIPPLFHGPLMSWFFNPHIGYYADSAGIYHNSAHTTHNIILTCSECVIYTTLIQAYVRATRIAEAKRQVMKSDKRVYLQVILVGVIHFIAGSTYVLMQYVPVNLYTTLTASTFYLLSQGAPPIIYLVLNRKLRLLVLIKLHLIVRIEIPGTQQKVTAIGKITATAATWRVADNSTHWVQKTMMAEATRVEVKRPASAEGRINSGGDGAT